MKQKETVSERLQNPEGKPDVGFMSGLSRRFTRPACNELGFLWEVQFVTEYFGSTLDGSTLINALAPCTLREQHHVTKIAASQVYRSSIADWKNGYSQETNWDSLSPRGTVIGVTSHLYIERRSTEESKNNRTTTIKNKEPSVYHLLAKDLHLPDRYELCNLFYLSLFVRFIYTFLVNFLLKEVTELTSTFSPRLLQFFVPLHYSLCFRVC